MKTNLQIVALLAIAAIAAVFAQGPLTPPPGAPAPAMKTLDQIEPRTEINAANTPGDADSIFKITRPGSYYLTGGLAGVAAKQGIEITASDVTLDLMGFALTGVGGSLGGVSVNANVSGLTIRNGTARGWRQSGIGTSNANGCILENLQASGNGFSGILAGENATVRDCTARTNTGIGISAQSGSTIVRCTAGGNTTTGIGSGFAVTISHCAASSNGGIGIRANNNCTVSDCVSRQNGSHGIEAGDHCIVKGSTSDANAGTAKGIVAGRNASLQHCTATGNADGGIACETGCTLVHCIAAENTGQAGIDVGDGCTLTHCTARLNTWNGTSSSGIDAGFSCALIACSATGNTNTHPTASGSRGVGLAVRRRSTVRGCICEDNKGFHIDVHGSGCVIADNTCGPNSGELGGGIFLDASSEGCRVDGNHCTLCAPCILVDGKANIIVRNSTYVEVGPAYEVAAGNHLARIISNPGLDFSATSPWANFEFYY